VHSDFPNALYLPTVVHSTVLINSHNSFRYDASVSVSIDTVRRYARPAVISFQQIKWLHALISRLLKYFCFYHKYNTSNPTKILQLKWYTVKQLPVNITKPQMLNSIKILQLHIRRSYVILKAHSHIPCRSHTAHMPFPCHVVPKLSTLCLSHLIYTVQPCLIHTCHAARVPCHDHAFWKRLLKATAQRGMDMAWHGMWVTCPRSASFGYHAEFHEGFYQKHTNPLNCTTRAVRIFPATTRTFTKDTTLPENGRGAARHGRGTAWAGHDIRELALTVNCFTI
jgi:hypothetical protein